MRAIDTGSENYFLPAAWPIPIEDLPNRPDLDILLPTPPRRKRILLADADAAVREILGRILESEHYQVTLANDGNEAVSRFAAEAPDLVLLDLNLPDQSAWPAFGLMNAGLNLVPVVVITARADQHQQASELGVDALMEKPLDLPVLLAAIKDLLEETEAKRVRRLADPEFKTVILKPRRCSPVNGVHL